MKPFRDWKIRTKLISFTLLLALVLLGVGALLSLGKLTEDLKQSHESDLEHIVGNIHAMCRAQQELLQNKITADLNTAHYVFFQNGRSVSISHDQFVEFTVRDQSTNELSRVRVPLDLVILDVIMPEMDGFEACQQIRQIASYAETPVMMLTAKSGEEDRQRGLEMGANIY